MSTYSKHYFEFRNDKNLKPTKLSNKEKLYTDLTNIEYSWSGRLDMWNFGNTFIMEAQQLLINAIELFELGYFDCAYYSLRSAVEISTTIVFLADMPEDERRKFTDDWKKTKDFPMQGQMLKFLSENGNAFADMKEKMTDFFREAKELSSALNKYVHKQGFRHFYVARNHPVNNTSQDIFITNFEYHIKKCIGIVAVMRLAIDPFPIMLMDEEILYRCFDSMTEAYTDEFVEEYIGQDVFEAYKTTDLYQMSYNSFIVEECKTPSVFSVVKHQYIDSTKMAELLKQLHLMSKDDVISVLMVYACNKVIKIYSSGGLQMYFTEKDTNRKAMSWSSADLIKFEKTKEKINQPYDEAYISVFIFDNQSYFIEHNELLSPEDTAQILGIVQEALSKMHES